MNQNLQTTFEEAQPKIATVGHDLLTHIGEFFTLTPEQARIYKLVFQYFNQDIAFEMTPEKYSLKKGILICGGIGVGKTFLFQIFEKILRSENNLQLFELVDSNTIVREFLINGFPVIDKYSSQHYFAKKSLDRIPKGLCIDDIGMEDQKAKSFGNEANVIQQILYERHRQMGISGMKTFGTTNVQPTQLGNMYGQRTADRMQQMFNIILFTGKSLRK